MSENNPPFDADTERKLQRLADDLPAIWEGLRGLGFRLPDLEVGHIETMRVRPSDERPYDYYFQEVLKEKLSFYHAFWLPEKRAEWQRWVYRSDYLDHLQTKVDAGFYSFLGERAKNTRVILDPNFILYTGLGLTDIDRMKGFSANYQAQKKREIETLNELIRVLSAPPCKPTPTRIARLLEDVLVPIGFETALLDVKRGRFVFRRALKANLALYCEYDDHHAMVKGHMWHLAYVFQSPDAPLWERLEYRSVPLAFGLDSFLPNYLSYLKHRGEWDSIVLGCLVNAKLLGLIVEKWKTY